MDTKDIKDMLHSFYQGETTHEEEKILYEFFSKETVPEELLSEKRIFMKLYPGQQNDVPLHLEEKLSTLIDNLAKEEESRQTQRIVPIKQVSKSWRWAVSIAASVLLVLSAGILSHLNKNDNNPMLVDTYASPEDAYIETQKTLLLVSNKLNKGIEQMQKVNEVIDNR